jgi:hypothetical protein
MSAFGTAQLLEIIVGHGQRENVTRSPSTPCVRLQHKECTPHEPTMHDATWGKEQRAKSEVRCFVGLYALWAVVAVHSSAWAAIHSACAVCCATSADLHAVRSVQARPEALAAGSWQWWDWQISWQLAAGGAVLCVMCVICNNTSNMHIDTTSRCRLPGSSWWRCVMCCVRYM